jgi:hypothetical protein
VKLAKQFLYQIAQDDPDKYAGNASQEPYNTPKKRPGNNFEPPGKAAKDILNRAGPPE